MRRNWTKEEVEYLQDNWGDKSIKAIANHLNRSVNAIIVKAQRLELGRHIDAGDYVTYNQLIRALGYTGGSGYLTKRLKRDGFPMHYKASIKKKYAVVKLEEFWKWTKDNKQKINFANFPKGALGKEPEWVDDKRKADMKSPSKINHNKPWTKEDDNKLIFMCKQNRYTYKDAAEELNRTQSAVKRRLYDLAVPYRPVPLDNHVKWTFEENMKILELHRKGYDTSVIAKELNKTQLSISDRLSARKDDIEYVVLRL